MPIDANSPAVQSHLQILQGIINRMAGNSSFCKGWCITIVSAIFVVLLDNQKQYYGYIAFVPILLFYSLDSYYLILEFGFRDSYNAFIKKLHTEELAPEDLFVVKPKKMKFSDSMDKCISISVILFYVTLIIMTILFTWVI